jgi:hypothetical protein
MVIRKPLAVVVLVFGVSQVVLYELGMRFNPNSRYTFRRDMNGSGGSLDQPIGMRLVLSAGQAQRRTTVRFRCQSDCPLGCGRPASGLPK